MDANASRWYDFTAYSSTLLLTNGVKGLPLSTGATGATYGDGCPQEAN
ncbi:MAG: hypothetical protein ABIS18_03385 [Actinomycetota bacterium]